MVNIPGQPTQCFSIEVSNDANPVANPPSLGIKITLPFFLKAFIGSLFDMIINFILFKFNKVDNDKFNFQMKMNPSS
jgi:hypothetical protein